MSKFLNRHAMITEILDNVANSVQAKGLTKEAEEIDVISNTIDKLSDKNLDIIEVEQNLKGIPDLLNVLLSDGTEMTLTWLPDESGWDWHITRGNKSLNDNILFNLAKKAVQYAREKGLLKGRKMEKFRKI